jgi:hypothetical protein
MTYSTNGMTTEAPNDTTSLALCPSPGEGFTKAFTWLNGRTNCRNRHARDLKDPDCDQASPHQSDLFFNNSLATGNTFAFRGYCLG